MNDILKNTKSGLNNAWDSVSSNLPKSLLFWTACGAVVAAGTVYFVKPLRNGLMSLLGLSKRKAAAKKRAVQHRVYRMSHRRSTPSRKGVRHAVRSR
jgi:hypothetical protein